MELVRGHPLQQITEVGDPADLYDRLMNLLLKFANHGVIHGDFNEFNIMVKDDGSPVVIDFPQMVSTEHADARFFFDRDVNCLRDFFRRRFGYESELSPSFEDIERVAGLDAEVAASGVTKQMEKDLLKEYGEGAGEEDSSDDDGDGEDEEDGEDGEEEEEDQSIDEMRKELSEALSIGQKEAKAKEAAAAAKTEEDVEVKNASDEDRVGGGRDKEEEEAEDLDDLADLHLQNKGYRPFRDAADRQRIPRAPSSAASSVAPEEVKRRVKAGLEKQKRVEARRRARAKGEASAVTRQRRDNRENISTSTSAFWDS